MALTSSLSLTSHLILEFCKIVTRADGCEHVNFRLLASPSPSLAHVRVSPRLLQLPSSRLWRRQIVHFFQLNYLFNNENLITNIIPYIQSIPNLSKGACGWRYRVGHNAVCFEGVVVLQPPFHNYAKHDLFDRPSTRQVCSGRVVSCHEGARVTTGLAHFAWLPLCVSMFRMSRD